MTDFGIARTSDDTSALTQPGIALGTPAYAAPETLATGARTASADVYSLAALLHELVTGSTVEPGGRRDAGHAAGVVASDARPTRSPPIRPARPSAAALAAELAELESLADPQRSDDADDDRRDRADLERQRRQRWPSASGPSATPALAAPSAPERSGAIAAVVVASVVVGALGVAAWLGSTSGDDVTSGW